MLACDLDLYENEIKEIESENNHIDLQLGTSTWDVEFEFYGKTQRVRLLGFTHVKENNLLLSIPDKYVITTKYGVYFPGSGVIEFSKIREMIKDNYIDDYKQF